MRNSDVDCTGRSEQIMKSTNSMILFLKFFFFLIIPTLYSQTIIIAFKGCQRQEDSDGFLGTPKSNNKKALEYVLLGEGGAGGGKKADDPFEANPMMVYRSLSFCFLNPQNTFSFTCRYLPSFKKCCSKHDQEQNVTQLTFHLLLLTFNTVPVECIPLPICMINTSEPKVQEGLHIKNQTLQPPTSMQEQTINFSKILVCEGSDIITSESAPNDFPRSWGKIYTSCFQGHFFKTQQFLESGEKGGGVGEGGSVASCALSVIQANIIF